MTLNGSEIAILLAGLRALRSAGDARVAEIRSVEAKLDDESRRVPWDDETEGDDDA